MPASCIQSSGFDERAGHRLPPLEQPRHHLRPVEREQQSAPHPPVGQRRRVEVEVQVLEDEAGAVFGTEPGAGAADQGAGLLDRAGPARPPPCPPDRRGAAPPAPACFSTVRTTMRRKPALAAPVRVALQRDGRAGLDLRDAVGAVPEAGMVGSVS
jgi:hypothetical protein